MTLKLKQLLNLVVMNFILYFAIKLFFFVNVFQETIGIIFLIAINLFLIYHFISKEEQTPENKMQHISELKTQRERLLIRLKQEKSLALALELREIDDKIRDDARDLQEFPKDELKKINEECDKLRTIAIALKERNNIKANKILEEI